MKKIVWFFILAFLGHVEAHLIEQVCEKPRIFLIRGFLSEAECDYLIAYAQPRLARSLVADEKTAQNQVHQGRTSSGMFCPSQHGDPILQAIEHRIAEKTSIPASHGESIQILHYAVGEEYRPHYDFFDPNVPGGAVHFHRGGQRVISFLMYLNTPEQGGETVFPLAKVAIRPAKGDAIFFYNVDTSGEADRFSLHGGAPVLAGEKWLATRWLRAHPFR